METPICKTGKQGPINTCISAAIYYFSNLSPPKWPTLRHLQEEKFKVQENHTERESFSQSPTISLFVDSGHEGQQMDLSLEECSTAPAKTYDLLIK